MIAFICDQSTVMPVRVQVLQTPKIEWVPHSSKNGFLLVYKNSQSCSYFEKKKYYSIYKINLFKFYAGRGVLKTEKVKIGLHLQSICFMHQNIMCISLT